MQPESGQVEAIQCSEDTDEHSFVRVLQDCCKPKIISLELVKLMLMAYVACLCYLFRHD